LDIEKIKKNKILHHLGHNYIIKHKFFDFLEWIDLKTGTSLIKGIETILQKGVGPDVMARHPMSFYAAEEDDLIFSSVYGCGYYAGIQFPDEITWYQLGQMSKFNKYEKEKCFQLYCRINQKVMYRRGEGRTLIAKSHLIEFVDILKERLPNAKFVDIVRHPKDSFGSWVGLQQSASKVFVKTCFPDKDVTRLHLKFWELYFTKEMEIFNNSKENIHSNRFTQLTFKEYVVDPVGVAKMLYNKWNLPYDGTEFQKRVEASVSDHKKYKSKHSYHNPTLEELGTSLEVIEDKFSNYIKVCKL